MLAQIRIGLRRIVAVLVASVPGTGTVWIFGGIAGGVPTSSVEKYDLATDARTLGTALGAGDSGYGYAAAGNTIKAILHGSGSEVTQARKYTYATMVTANSGVMGQTGVARAATQSGTKGFWFGGQSSSSPYTLSQGVDIVPFATDVRAAGTSLSTTRILHAAASDANFAIVAGGENMLGQFFATAEKYNFSDDVVTNASSLSDGRDLLGAFANTQRGIFVGGYLASTADPTALVERYTWATGVRDFGTSLPAERFLIGSAGNNSRGLVTGSTIAHQDETSTALYNHSTGTWAAGTALLLARNTAEGACDSPGGQP